MTEWASQALKEIRDLVGQEECWGWNPNAAAGQRSVKVVCDERWGEMREQEIAAQAKRDLEAIGKAAFNDPPPAFEPKARNLMEEVWQALQNFHRLGLVEWLFIGAILGGLVKFGPWKRTT